ncbi:MAG: sugar O-acetyltransferase [Clostridia bacterium]
MQNEETKLLAGLLFAPGAPELRKIKLRTHNLCTQFNRTFEDEVEKRAQILADMFDELGKGSFLQGPIYIHYGKHTRIGQRFFGNFNLTIQDDALVTIGNDCNFGPNVTLVTPVHPMLAQERRGLQNQAGETLHLCYAKPIAIGDDCWLGANVVVCPGVTIGEGCVVGAGSVVTRDIPAMSFAAGNPCRVIRAITPEDSMTLRPELWGNDLRLNK